MTPETALYDFLTIRVLATAEQSDLDVQATAYQNLERVKTVRIGNAETQFAPGGGNVVKEFDCDITLQVLVRVEDTDRPESFNLARESATGAASWLIDQIHADDHLGGRACGVNVYRSLRGWAKIAAAPYAVILIPIRVNPISYE